MPPPKIRPTQDDSSIARDRTVTSTSHIKKSKQQANFQPSAEVTLKDAGTALNEPGTGSGTAWSHESLEVLNAYRVAYNLNTPAAFTTPLRQAILTNPGIGRQSPTMARRKDKRRIPREQLANAVRKNFNGAAVNETDVVVELVYKVRHQDKTFRMRSTPTAIVKK